MPLWDEIDIRVMGWLIIGVAQVLLQQQIKALQSLSQFRTSLISEPTDPQAKSKRQPSTVKKGRRPPISINALSLLNLNYMKGVDRMMQSTPGDSLPSSRRGSVRGDIHSDMASEAEILAPPDANFLAEIEQNIEEVNAKVPLDGYLDVL